MVSIFSGSEMVGDSGVVVSGLLSAGFGDSGVLLGVEGAGAGEDGAGVGELGAGAGALGEISAAAGGAEVAAARKEVETDGSGIGQGFS